MSGDSAEPDVGVQVCVVLVTGPDRESLLRLGRRLVEEELAACVNVTEGVRSVYRWQGEVHEEDEGLALVKTTRGRLDDLEARVVELHPYDEPEFLALSVDEGARSYLDWVANSVTPTAT